jgi:hypothetical protein
MRILIGSDDVCGLIYDLGEEYKNQGHQVITISNAQHPLIKHSYNIDPNDLIYSFVQFKSDNHNIAITSKKIVNLFGKFFENGVNSLIIRNLLRWPDIYINVLQPNLWEEERFFKYLKKRNKKIITLFTGCDIRDYVLFKKKFNIRRWHFSEEINKPGATVKKRRLEIHEKYSDAIFSVPDQSMLAKRPYFHLQIPMNISKFSKNIPNRDVPIIIHAPSNPEKKGTDLILETLNSLKREGFMFELKLIRNLRQEELLKELTNADILIDEIVLHGPGFLSFEAMLSGCSVATKYLENSPVCFTPPILNINEDNILQQLRLLLSNKDLRLKLANDGYKYAFENNNVIKVALDILTKLNVNSFDYYPE